MKRILLILASLTSLASAQAVGDYLLLRKKAIGQEPASFTPGTNNLLSISAGGIITPIPKTTYEPALTIGTGLTRTGATLSVNMAALTPPWSGITGAPNFAALYQPLDSDLTSIAALTTTTYGRSVLTAADAAALRTLQGLGTLATASSVTSSLVSDATSTWTAEADDGKVVKFGLDGLLSPRFIFSKWARAEEQQYWGQGCTFEYADAAAASNHRAALELDTYFAKTSAPAADGSDEGKLASWDAGGGLTPNAIYFPGGGFISAGSFLFVDPNDPTKESGIAGSAEVGSFINSLPSDSGKYFALTTNINGAATVPISTGVTGLGTGIATFLATPSGANLASALTTALPASKGGTGLTSLGTGIATALGTNTGSAGAPVLFNGALGTPTSGTVTNLTGTASININGTVGATTPATGAFTAATASTSLTAPAINGGTGAGDDVIIQGTTNATRTGSHVVLQPNGGLTYIGAGTPVADTALPLQLSTAGTGTETNIGINRDGAYGFLLGYKNGTGGSFANYRGGYMRQVTTDPFGIIVNNTQISTLWNSDGSVGLGGSITNTTTLAGAHLIINGTTGGLTLQKTVTAGGTTTAQTINKPSGSINFAAGDTSKVVTNSLCNTSSVIILTMASNDSTAAGLRVVAGSGSFTIHCATAPAGEMRVNFLLTN